MNQYTLEELAKLLEVEFQGDPQVLVTGLATLKAASSGQLSFYHNPRFVSDLTNTKASVVILHSKHAELCPCDALFSDNPYASYAKISQLFERRHKHPEGIHTSASVHVSALIGPGSSIGPNVVIAEGVVLGANVVIQANCVVGTNSQIGEESILHPNVVLYHDVKLGARVKVHSSTVIGSDGFGYAKEGEKYLKIAQLGGVSIDDDVDIGSSCSIDRGALEDTKIGSGVKIDNQVQIAHNVVIGDNTVICGCSAIAGSSNIGKNCTIAGGVGIINHIIIADNVTVTAMSLVNQDIKQPGFYSSGTGLSDTGDWKKNIVRFRELDSMSKRLNALEKQIN